jgi:DNA-directed RNA polymerase subunit RPC12/RpoP
MAAIEFECPACNQPLEAPEEMAGDVIECPACGQALELPGEPEPEGDDLQCPECSTVWPAGTVLCVGCGYHFEAGGVIQTDLS